MKMSVFGLQENELLGFAMQLSFRAEHSLISPEVKQNFPILKLRMLSISNLVLYHLQDLL